MDALVTHPLLLSDLSLSLLLLALYLLLVLHSKPAPVLQGWRSHHRHRSLMQCAVLLVGRQQAQAVDVVGVKVGVVPECRSNFKEWVDIGTISPDLVTDLTTMTEFGWRLNADAVHDRFEERLKDYHSTINVYEADMMHELEPYDPFGKTCKVQVLPGSGNTSVIQHLVEQARSDTGKPCKNETGKFVFVPPVRILSIALNILNANKQKTKFGLECYLDKHYTDGELDDDELCVSLESLKTAKYIVLADADAHLCVEDYMKWVGQGDTPASVHINCRLMRLPWQIKLMALS